MSDRADLALDEPAPAERRLATRVKAGLAVGVLLVAGLGYALTGAPGRIGLGPAAPAAPAAMSTTPPSPNADDLGAPAIDPQVAQIVGRIAQRLENRADDAAGWALLARAQAALGRPGDAVPAFRKALALAGDDAALMADFADALAAQNNGRSGPEGVALIERALVLAPDNVRALALSGSVAFDNRAYATAARQWEKAEQRLPAGSAMLPSLRASIVQARALGGLEAASPAAAGASRAETIGVPPETRTR